MPGLAEGWLQLVAAVGGSSRLDAAWRHLPEWLGDAGTAPRISRDRPASKILFFTYYPDLVEISLALACLMVGRGAQVHLAWLGHSEHSPEIRLRHPVWRRQAQRAEAMSRGTPLKLISFDQVVPANEWSEFDELAARQAAMDVSYICRRERLNLQGDADQGHLYAYRTARNVDALRRLSSVLASSNYDQVVMPNGAIMELGAAFKLVSRLGMPVSTFEMWERTGTIVTSFGSEPVMRITTGALWAADGLHRLTPDRKQRVAQIMERRSRPKGASATRAYSPGDARTQSVAPASPERLRAELGLSPGKHVVLLCPNVPFDSIFYLTDRRVFQGMWQWLTETVRFLGGRDDCEVVVRAHPAEPLYGSSETAGSLIEELCSPLPRNLRLIRPNAPVNTYALMDIADIGSVYASTTGLEMALRGLPVICGVPDQHYNGKGFTIDPESRDEYFAALNRVLQDPESCRLSDRQVELASCYAELFFERWPRAFPWTAGSGLLDDVKQWPIRRVLADDGWTRFGQPVDDLIWGGDD